MNPLLPYALCLGALIAYLFYREERKARERRERLREDMHRVRASVEQAVRALVERAKATALQTRPLAERLPAMVGDRGLDNEDLFAHEEEERLMQAAARHPLLPVMHNASRQIVSGHARAEALRREQKSAPILASSAPSTDNEDAIIEL